MVARRHRLKLVNALKYVSILLLSLVLLGCSSNDEQPDIAADAGEQQMYEEAQRYLRGQSYDLAVRALQLLESRYPFGKYAEQAGTRPARTDLAMKLGTRDEPADTVAGKTRQPAEMGRDLCGGP